MEPKDCITQGHDITGGNIDDLKFRHSIVKLGTYVWNKPPAAADICTKELYKSRMKQKRLFSYYVFSQIIYTFVDKVAK